MPEDPVEQAIASLKARKSKDPTEAAIESLNKSKKRDEGFLGSLSLPLKSGPFSTDAEITGKQVLETLFPMGGSIAGGIAGFGAGGPGMAAVGSGAGFHGGAEVLEGLRATAPGVFGEPRESEAIISESLINAMFDVGFAGASKVPGMKTKIAEFIGKRTNVPGAIRESLGKVGEDVPVTPGTARKGIVGVIEDIFNPRKKREILDAAAQTITRRIEDTTGLTLRELPLKTMTGKAGKAATREAFFTRKQLEKEAWDSFRSSVKPQIFQTPNGPELFTTPVFGTEAFQTAKRLKTQLGPLIDNNARDAVDDFTARKWNVIKSKLETLTETKRITGQDGKSIDVPLFDYDTQLKEMRSDIWGRLTDKEKGTRVGHSLREIADAIDRDVQRTFPRSDKATTKLSGDLLEEAKEQTRRLYQIFPEEVRKAMDGDASQFFEEAMKSPEAAARFRNAIVGKEITRNEIAKNPRAKEASTELLSRFFNSVIKEEEGVKVLDMNKALKAFQSREFQGLTKELLTSRQASALEDLFRVGTFVSPRIGMSGKVALVLRETSAHITLASQLAKALTAVAVGGSAVGLGAAFTGTAAFTVSAAIGLRQFTNKVLLDPKLAKIASGLQKAPPGSPQYNRGVRALFGALKGVEVSIIGRDKEGKESQLGTTIVPDNIDELLRKGATRDF